MTSRYIAVVAFDLENEAGRHQPTKESVEKLVQATIESHQLLDTLRLDHVDVTVVQKFADR